GGLLLDGQQGILMGGDSGPAVVPGRPGQSLLLKAVRHEADATPMPPRGKLSDREVAVLEEWVRRGAPVPAAAGPVGPGQTIDLSAGRKFWSFQQPRRV